MKRISDKVQVMILVPIAVILVFVAIYVDRATSVVTLTEYKQLSIGMSEKEASSILNKDSKLLYEKKRDDGVVVKAYMWSNADGSFVEARFENNRLRYKTERGLPEKDK